MAFARGRAVGVDSERMRENLNPEKIARRCFWRHQQNELSALPPGRTMPGLLSLLDPKRSLHQSGAGLSLPLDEFDLSRKTRGSKCVIGRTRSRH
jgi:phosphopantetheinyl transferase